MVLQHLRRVRWAVRATLFLGVAASVAANILHAQDNPISQAIAAWPPLALLLTVELISRVPVHRPLLAAGRLVATAAIAGIAAWVSYWHMAGVAARYGETGASTYLLPLSVDGLIVVASICLVELGGRIAALESRHGEAPTSGDGAAGEAAAGPAPGETAQPVTGTAIRELVAVRPVVADKGTGSPARDDAGDPAPRTTAPSPRTGRKQPTSRPRRSPAETVALATRIKAERPSLTDHEIAAELGISTSRLRTVMREAAPAADHTLAA